MYAIQSYYENGRQVEVRINDRGPFKKGRIVDVSRRAAEILDFIPAVEEGATLVRIGTKIFGARDYRK